MKNSVVKEIVIPAISLLLICIVATALLGFTNQITAPKIEQLAIETQMKAKQEVLSSASEFSEEKTVSLDGVDYAYYEGTANGEKVGFVFATSAKGYGGDIKIMVGIDNTGAVTGVSILEIEETAGLGMNAKNESFLSQYTGKSNTLSVIKNGEKGENDIQALTGATITSNAMTKAVNIALDLYKEVGGESVG